MHPFDYFARAVNTTTSPLQLNPSRYTIPTHSTQNHPSRNSSKQRTPQPSAHNTRITRFKPYRTVPLASQRNPPKHTLNSNASAESTRAPSHYRIPASSPARVLSTQSQHLRSLHVGIYTSRYYHYCAECVRARIGPPMPAIQIAT